VLSNALFLAFALTFAFAASLFDLKERRIPDWLNYSFLAAALVFGWIQGVFGTTLLFSAVAFVFAFVLFKAGVWAGGDAKFFSSLSAFLPLLGKTSVFALGVWFVLSVALLALFYFAFGKGASQTPISKLKQGLIPAESVVLLEGKAVKIGFPHYFLLKENSVVADARFARGLDERNIIRLKKLGVKWLLTREPWVFAPFLSFGFFVVTVFFG
jgi:Flp pilus assembly protein protease CpaA